MWLGLLVPTMWWGGYEKSWVVAQQKWVRKSTLSTSNCLWWKYKSSLYTKWQYFLGEKIPERINSNVSNANMPRRLKYNHECLVKSGFTSHLRVYLNFVLEMINNSSKLLNIHELIQITFLKLTIPPKNLHFSPYLLLQNKFHGWWCHTEGRFLGSFECWMT